MKSVGEIKNDNGNYRDGDYGKNGATATFDKIKEKASEVDDINVLKGVSP